MKEEKDPIIVGAQVEVRSDLDWEGRFDIKYPPVVGHRVVEGRKELKDFILNEIKLMQARSRAEALAEVRAGMPPEDTTPDANEYERADRIAWNACRTAVLDLLTKLTTPVGE